MSILLRVLQESGYLVESDGLLLEAKQSASISLRKEKDPARVLLVGVVGIDQGDVDDTWGGTGKYNAFVYLTLRNRLSSLVSGQLSEIVRKRKPDTLSNDPSGLYWRGGLFGKVDAAAIKAAFPSPDFTVRKSGSNTWSVQLNTLTGAGGDFRPPAGQEWPVWARSMKAIELNSFLIATNAKGTSIKVVPDKITFNRTHFDTAEEREKRAVVQTVADWDSDKKRKFFARTPGALALWTNIYKTVDDFNRAATVGDQERAVQKRTRVFEGLKKTYGAYPEIVSLLDDLHKVTKKARRKIGSSTKTVPVEADMKVISYEEMRDKVAPILRKHHKGVAKDVEVASAAAAAARRAEVAAEPDDFDWGTREVFRPGESPAPEAPDKIEVKPTAGKGGTRGTGTWEVARRLKTQGTVYEITVKRLSGTDDRTVAADYGNKLNAWVRDRGGRVSNLVLLGLPSKTRVNFETPDRSTSGDIFSSTPPARSGDEELPAGDDKIRLIALIVDKGQ